MTVVSEQGAGVGIDGVTKTEKWIPVQRPGRVAIKVGKHAKIAVIK